eukprot:4864066-Amphidinium_carterae.3
MRPMTPKSQGVVAKFMYLDAWTSKRCFIRDAECAFLTGFPSTFGDESCPYVTFTSPEGRDV